MKNYYKKAGGYFDFSEFYDYVINLYDNAIFVEIGVYRGRSIMYMAEKIKELNKNIKLYGIDTFEGLPYNSSPLLESEEGYNMYEIYVNNIKPLKDIINTVIGDSRNVYENFKNESIDFVFIDGSHSYEDVKTDIELWFPKIKIGGIISGHDYEDCPINKYGVIQAVNEAFPDGNFSLTGKTNNVWYHKKQ